MFTDPKIRVRTNSITKTIIRIFAISIVKPAIPLAPSRYATKAMIRKRIASPSRSTIFDSEQDPDEALYQLLGNFYKTLLLFWN
jgi:hypothetical protein